MINEQPSNLAVKMISIFLAVKSPNLLPGFKVLDDDNNCITIAELEAPQEL